MSNLPHPDVPVVTHTAHLTLHYRLSSEKGEDIVSTFDARPATLQMGSGQLAPCLENCLLELKEGAHRTFTLMPEEAFGVHNPQLLQRVSRDMLMRNSPAGVVCGDTLTFSAPNGKRFTGMVREVDEEGAWLDFNHPLVGQKLRFEVKIMGILS